MEGINDPPKTQTSGDIGIDRIMELDPGSIEGDDSFDNGDPETCATGTMCYDLVSLQLVLSDHLILAFQQGHQAFPPLLSSRIVSPVLLAIPTNPFCPWFLFV
jgi:hypothetical protein